MLKICCTFCKYDYVRLKNVCFKNSLNPSGGNKHSCAPTPLSGAVLPQRGGGGPLTDGVCDHLGKFRHHRSRQISAKCCSFSAVLVPIFASKYAFFSIFQNLPDYLADFFQILQNFADFAT